MMTSQVDREFVAYFRKLGYTMDWDHQPRASEIWHEIMKGPSGSRQILVQVDIGTPLAEFLRDLPYFARDERGISKHKFKVTGSLEDIKALYDVVLAHRPSEEIAL